MLVNKRKKVVVIALIIFSSLFTSLMFQNCSGGIQSQAQFPSTDSNNQGSSAPPPVQTGCTGNPPPSEEVMTSSCPAARPVGTGIFNVYSYQCIGNSYVKNSTPVVSDRCSATNAVPLSDSDIRDICRKYIKTAEAATIKTVVPGTTVTRSTLKMISGLGDGVDRAGNGDVAAETTSAIVDPKISAGSQGNEISPGVFEGIDVSNYGGVPRTQNRLFCNYQTRVSCSIDLAASTITKAINMDSTSINYGKDEVELAKDLDLTSKAALLDTLKARVFSTANNNGATPNTCAFPFNSPLTDADKDFALAHIRDPKMGYRCVAGSIKFKMTAQTSVSTELGGAQGDSFRTKLASAPGEYSEITVTVQNGCWDENRLVPNPSSLPTVANYGSVVAASDKWLVSLSPSDNNGSLSQVGSVSIFDKNNLSLPATKLYLPGLTGGGSMGDSTVSASLNKDSLVVSAFNRSTYIGKVFYFVFENSRWTQKGPILEKGNAAISFGYAVSLSADSTSQLLAVGAPRYTNSQTSNDMAGHVFIYRCNPATGCSPLTEITSLNPGAYFGAAVSLSGNRLAVGAPYLPAASDSHGDGFVRVFDISGTSVTQVSQLLPPGNQSISTGRYDIQITNPVEPNGVRRGRQYGSSVSVNGNRLIVGAPYKSTLNGTTLSAKTGEAYYYSSLTSPSNVVTLNYTGAAADSRYGQGVALNSKGAFTGCPYCQNLKGQIYYFPFDSSGAISSTAQRAVFPLDRIVRDGFGNAIFATDEDVVVGASNRTVDSSSSAGAAYRYAAP